MNEELELNTQKFKHVISLGYFCSVASELERLGLRDGSYPFDWLISDFCGVMACIDNKFEGFLDYKLLKQSSKVRTKYINTLYNIEFIHDFSEYKPLAKQLEKVQQKYARRIERFYKRASEPTLFVRYISDESENTGGYSTEIEYIEKNYKTIIGILKGLNSENNIIFIANEDVTSEIIPIFHVQKDENDTVARKPFLKNNELFKTIDNIYMESKELNQKRYLKKERRKNSIVRLKWLGLTKKVKNAFLTKYIHESVY